MTELWLAAVLDAAKQSLPLALEISECARLIKGYGDTHKRGTGNFRWIFQTLVQGEPSMAPAARAEAIAKARKAALADPDGTTLSKELGQPKPVVWLSSKRAEMLSE